MRAKNILSCINIEEPNELGYGNKSEIIKDEEKIAK